jgi:hypothetical protein
MKLFISIAGGGRPDPWLPVPMAPGRIPQKVQKKYQKVFGSFRKPHSAPHKVNPVTPLGSGCFWLLAQVTPVVTWPGPPAGGALCRQRGCLTTQGAHAAEESSGGRTCGSHRSSRGSSETPCRCQQILTVALGNRWGSGLCGTNSQTGH